MPYLREPLGAPLSRTLPERAPAPGRIVAAKSTVTPAMLARRRGEAAADQRMAGSPLRRRTLPFVTRVRHTTDEIAAARRPAHPQPGGAAQEETPATLVGQ